MNTLRKAITASAMGPIRETGKGTYRKTFFFADDFIGFAGHFPGYPVLPAFVQILTATALAEEALGRPIGLRSVVKAKFRIEIRAGWNVEVECRERSVGGEPGFEATLTVEDGAAASILFTFTEI